MATSMAFREGVTQDSTVEFSSGGRSVRLTGDQFDRVASDAARRNKQRELDLDQDGARIYSAEDLFEAQTLLDDAEVQTTMFKERAKTAKLDEDEARTRVRRIHRAIKSQRALGVEEE